jgi:hypothetical protein
MIAQGGGSMLQHYGNSLQKALRAIYPDYIWDTFKFRTLKYGHWNKMDNQREFMDNLAKQLSIFL